jgi:uncharacterized protein (DUF305 family)
VTTPASTGTTAPAPEDRPVGGLTRRWGSRGTVIVLALGGLVLLLVGAVLGVALAPQRQNGTPSPSAVDIGFAQDMIVHHNQGVLMAHYAEMDTTDSEVAVVAYDINYTQTAQLGQLQGFLSLWNQPISNSGTVMSWMGGASAMSGMHMGGATTGAASTFTPHDGAVMPGMATNTEMAKLKSLKGKDSDIYFLQLMIRHHQGGAEMMTYAGDHAALPQVRNLAGQMLQAQTQEISQMTQMLQARGAQPLPN